MKASDFVDRMKYFGGCCDQLRHEVELGNLVYSATRGWRYQMAPNERLHHHRPSWWPTWLDLSDVTLVRCPYCNAWLPGQDPAERLMTDEEELALLRRFHES